MTLIKSDIERVQSAEELALLLRQMILSGTFKQGERLPPIREIARLASLAPGTVAKAVSELQKDGFVTTEGRGGTKVARKRAAQERPRLFSMIPNEVAPGVLDLSNGFPDSKLFIPITALLDLDLSHFEINNYLTPPLLDELSKEIDERFKVERSSVTITNGSLDAIDRIVATTLTKGSKVLIEDPTFPPLIDILERHGVIAVPLAMDEFGVTPKSLVEGVRGGASAVILQLRCHNPTAITTTKERIEELADQLLESGLLVIEDDHSGLTRSTDDRTLMGYKDLEVVRVIGFSKLYGPDLRIAAIIGPRQVIQRINEDRRLGPSWTSHLIQRLLARLMHHDRSTGHNEEVARIYRERMRGLAQSLDTPDLIVSRDGLNAWIPTRSEGATIADLARVGVAVAPGSIFNFDLSLNYEYIRVTTASLERVPKSLIEVLNRWLPPSF